MLRRIVIAVIVVMMGLAVAQMGFRINAVLPGPVETPILVDGEAWGVIVVLSDEPLLRFSNYYRFEAME